MCVNVLTGKKPSLIWLLLAVGFWLLSALSLQSLSVEEVEDLQTLDQEVLISIILVYDKDLTTVENVLTDLENSAVEREIEFQQRNDDLIERENNLIDREAESNEIAELLKMEKQALKIQEELFQISLDLQKKNRTLDRILFGGGGVAVGVLLDRISLLF